MIAQKILKKKSITQFIQILVLNKKKINDSSFKNLESQVRYVTKKVVELT